MAAAGGWATLINWPKMKGMPAVLRPKKRTWLLSIGQNDFPKPLPGRGFSKRRQALQPWQYGSAAASCIKMSKIWLPDLRMKRGPGIVPGKKTIGSIRYLGHVSIIIP